MTAPRIEPGGRSELGLIGWGITRVSGWVGGTTPPNLFRTLGRHRALFRGWLRFAGRLMPGGTLPRRETELVILRVAHLRSCEYEFDHHVGLGRRVGVRPADIERVKAGPEAVGWSARERAVLSVVDGLHVTKDISDQAWDRLRSHLDERETIELSLLVGHYEMLATTIAALRIQPDEHRAVRRPKLLRRSRD
ncbi:MAG: carboxymuconolactone decarboxylase family protein [Aquihabitans sp.]